MATVNVAAVVVVRSATTREFLGFARHMAAFNTIIYWENNLEKMVIGRLIGSAPLGVYNLAERLMRTPSTAITATAGSVMFPSLSLIQADVESVKRVYLRANRLIAAVTFPAMAGLLALAEPLILSLVGEKWRGAIPLLQLLCLAGIAQSVYNTSGWIYLSYGRSDLLLRSGIYAFLARVAGVLIRTPLGRHRHRLWLRCRGVRVRVVPDVVGSRAAHRPTHDRLAEERVGAVSVRGSNGRCRLARQSTHWRRTRPGRAADARRADWDCGLRDPDPPLLDPGLAGDFREPLPPHGPSRVARPDPMRR